MPAKYSHLPKLSEKFRAIAQEITEDPKTWTQRDFGRTVDGIGVDAYDSRACCWCFYGFVGREEIEIPVSLYLVLPAILRLSAGTSIACWNDTPGRTPAEVATAFRHLAEHCEKEGN